MEMIEQIDRLMEQRPYCRDILSSFRDLLLSMGEARPQASPVRIENGMKDLKAKEGFPLFYKGDLPLDLKDPACLLERMLKHLKGKERADRKGIEKACDEISRNPEWARLLLKHLLEEKTEDVSAMARKVDLDPETIRFLGMTALKPFMQAVRKAYTDLLDKKKWGHGYCPLCGSKPEMAYFDKTGKRYLHCGTCGEEWQYPRLACPFCGNKDHESLGYFDSEQEEGFRVDFCRACMKYIKTVDKRVFEQPASMELEFLATVHLDLLAAQHGFK